jgi:hypothetical protein
MKILQYITAIITVLVLPLIGIIYHDIQTDIDKHDARLEKLDDEKVSNTTLVMMLEQQNVIIRNNKKEFDRVYSEIRDIRRGDE